MELATRNVLKHVYDTLLSRKRIADSGNISNFQLFYNRLISEYVASDKKGQCLVVPLTGQDVDDFYSRKMKRENFVEIIRTKVVTKVTHFDSGVLHKLCWECFSGSNDAQVIQMLTLVSPYSATLLWLVFCKLDTDGKLKLHPEDVTELLLRLLTHLRVTPDHKTVKMWLEDNMGSLAAWISFWPFFIVTVEKCLGPRGAQATSRAVQALYDEVVDEVMKKAQMIKKGHVRHTWKMRWFVLTSTDLIYYESKESLVKKGSMVLNERARVEVMMDKNEKDTRYPNRFKVVDGISAQFTEISADTPAQMNEWVVAINMVNNSTHATTDELHKPRAKSVFSHQYDPMDGFTWQNRAIFRNKTTKDHTEKHPSTVTQHDKSNDPEITRPGKQVEPPKIGVTILDQQIQGGQLQELVMRLEQSVIQLQQSVIQLQAGLSIEQETTQSLKSRCESLELSLTAEKQKSQSLEAKCNSQEERLRTLEDTVERL